MPASVPNFITVRVTDTDAPSLSATQTFTVIVVPRPIISSIQVSGGQVAIVWSAIDGQAYRVQSKNSLSDPWNNVSGDVTAAGSIATKADSSSPDHASILPRHGPALNIQIQQFMVFNWLTMSQEPCLMLLPEKDGTGI